MDIFEIVALRQYAWEQQLSEMTDYKPFTTFYADFTLAELCGGEDSVIDTYKDAFNSWKDDYRYITEMSLVLNHKVWEYYEKNESLAKVYNSLWVELDEWCCENLKGEAASYYYSVTD